MDFKLEDPNFDPRDFYREELMWCFHEFVIHRTDMYLVKSLYSWQLQMMRLWGNPRRIMLTCFQDFQAENEGFVRMVANYIGVHMTKKKKLNKSMRKKSDCPKLYRIRGGLNVSLETETILHRFFLKWNKVLREDFGIDCGWRRMLTC